MLFSTSESGMLYLWTAVNFSIVPSFKKRFLLELLDWRWRQYHPSASQELLTQSNSITLHKTQVFKLPSDDKMIIDELQTALHICRQTDRHFQCHFKPPMKHYTYLFAISVLKVGGRLHTPRLITAKPMLLLGLVPTPISVRPILQYRITNM